MFEAGTLGVWQGEEGGDARKGDRLLVLAGSNRKQCLVQFLSGRLIGHIIYVSPTAIKAERVGYAITKGC